MIKKAGYKFFESQIFGISPITHQKKLLTLR